MYNTHPISALKRSVYRSKTATSVRDLVVGCRPEDVWKMALVAGSSTVTVTKRTDDQ